MPIKSGNNWAVLTVEYLWLNHSTLSVGVRNNWRKYSYPYALRLSHWRLVKHICFSELSHHWPRLRIAASLALSRLLTRCQPDNGEPISLIFLSNYFNLRKGIWKCRLQNSNPLSKDHHGYHNDVWDNPGTRSTSQLYKLILLASWRTHASINWIHIGLYSGCSPFMHDDIIKWKY